MITPFSRLSLIIPVIISVIVMTSCDIVYNVSNNGGEISQYKSSWIHRAHKLQRGLDCEAPLAKSLFVGTHNSYNSAAYSEFFTYIDPNHIFSIHDQLEMDCRFIELDAHWYFSMMGPPWEWKNRILLSHAQGNDLGASSYDRPIEEGFEEINQWLRQPANQNEVVIMYIEDYLDGHYPEAIALLQKYFADIMYRPDGNGACQGIPMNISKGDILSLGKRLIIVSEGCRNNEWNRWVFSGVGDYNGSVFLTSGNRDSRCYPSCTEFTQEQYDHYMIRVFEDRTNISALFNPGPPITPEVMSELVKCGVNVIGTDKLQPFDGRLDSAIWSWDANQPDNYNNAEGCAHMWGNGRWNDNVCSAQFRYACRKPGTYDWRITAARGAWDGGVNACSAETGGEYVFAAPVNGFDNQKLKEKKEAAGAGDVWLNYHAEGSGAMKEWIVGEGSVYFRPGLRQTATLFQHCGYGGYAVSLPAGSYTLAQLSAMGLKNDDISSLRVPAGLKVTLFEHDNFQGRALIVAADDDCLVDNGANDMLSSIMVEENMVPYTPLSQLTETACYTITARHSGKCLDVSGASSDDGAAVIQWSGHGGDNQRWRLVPAGDGYFTITAKHSGKCLDVSGVSRDDGAGIIQWSGWGGDNQKFRLEEAGDGSYRIVAKHSGKCLDVSGASTGDGARVIQWSSWGGDNQKWFFTRVE